MLKGLCAPSIREAPVPIRVDGDPVGNFQGLEIFQNVAGTSFYPQTVADLASNTYFRLTYQKPDGSSATFGTSIVGAASFRTADTVFHFIPEVTGADVHTGNSHRLSISVSGAYEDLAMLSSIRTYAMDASINRTEMKMEVALTAIRDIPLDQTRLGNDSLRLFSVSSMYADPLHYDGNLIRYKDARGTKSLYLQNIQKRGRYLFSPLPQVSEFALLKDRWPESPSIAARIIESSLPIKELALQGYLAHTMSVDDDSLSLWIEWRKCPRVIPEGQKISAAIEFSAYPPEDYRSGPKRRISR